MNLNDSLLYLQGPQIFARMLGAFNHRELLASDFNASGKPFTANVAYVAANYSVPIGYHGVLKKGVSFGFYVYAKSVTTMAGGLAAGDFPIDLTAVGGIVQSTLKAPALPSTGGHPDVIAYNSSVGMVALPVKAINYDTNIVTVDRPAGCTSITLYYLPEQGTVGLRARRPTGRDQANPLLYQQSFRALHEVDQLSERTAPTFDDLKDLPARWQIQLEIESAAQVVFDAYAPHKIRLPFAIVPVEVLPGQASRYDAQAEVKLRGGRL